jgi:small GTP-binding protein
VAGLRQKVLLKVIILGDSGVGKTSLMNKYVSDKFSKQYKATIGADFLTKEIEIDDKAVTLQIWDTAGQEDYDRLRPLSYPQTDVFLVCFSVISEPSFNNVKQKWIPEITHHAPGVPILLIGTKSDLRNDNKMKQQLQGKGLCFVTEDAAKQSPLPCNCCFILLSFLKSLLVPIKRIGTPGA